MRPRLVRVGVCGPQRLLRQTLAAALGEAPGLEIVGVRRAPSNLRPLRLDVAVAIYPAAGDAARAAVAEVTPTPVLLVTSDAADAGVGVPCCDAYSSVAEIECALRLLAEEPPPVAALSVQGDGAHAGSPALTDRELQVLRLTSRGHTGEQIAERLGLTARTVANHRARVFAKLGVRSQSHAVAAAVREGLLVASADQPTQGNR